MQLSHELHAQRCMDFRCTHLKWGLLQLDTKMAQISSAPLYVHRHISDPCRQDSGNPDCSLMRNLKPNKTSPSWLTLRDHYERLVVVWSCWSIGNFLYKSRQHILLVLMLRAYAFLHIPSHPATCLHPSLSVLIQQHQTWALTLIFSLNCLPILTTLSTWSAH